MYSHVPAPGVATESIDGTSLSNAASQVRTATYQLPCQNTAHVDNLNFKKDIKHLILV